MMMMMMMHHNPHRRVFRGRAGPTDRRLPKYNARRRRKAPPVVVAGPEEPDRVHDQEQHQENDEENENDEESWSSSSSSSFQEESERLLEHQFQEANESNEKETAAAAATAEDAKAVVGWEAAATTATPPSPPPPLLLATERVETAQGDDNDDDDDGTTSGTINACEQELQHLGKRMQAIRQTMQLSSSKRVAGGGGGGGALSIPSNYQRHVLAAVHNTVTEWKAIRRHYTDELGGFAENHKDVMKSIGLALFELIQQALQCGPLSGAKPGYFKRCGSDVAHMVYDFLNKLPAHLHDDDDDENLSSLYLTEKQVDAIEKWKQAAKKAAEKETLPSKTVALQQQQAQQTVNKKREQKAKKYK